MSKTCAKCGVTKPVDDFHRQPTGQKGRHSYCKPCANRIQKESRVRNYSVENKRKWAFMTRYRITPEQYTAKLTEQNNACAICAGVMKRPCVDHNHQTGEVRGVLCHPCNIKLHAVEDANYRDKAMAYLEVYE